MKSIGIHALSTWSSELTNLVDEIISANDLCDVDIEINTLDLQPDQYKALEDYLKSECQIQFWHTTRLTPQEHDFIRDNGLYPLNDILIAQKIQVLRYELKESIPPTVLKQVIDKFETIAKSSSRSNYISARDSIEQLTSPMNLQTLTYWGGEALLCSFEELSLSTVLLEIGIPYLINIHIPYVNIADNVNTRSIPKSLIVARRGEPEYSSVTINSKVDPNNLSISKWEL